MSRSSSAMKARPCAPGLSSSSTCRSRSRSTACAACTRWRRALASQLLECTKPPSSACGPVAATRRARARASSRSWNRPSLIRATCSSRTRPRHSAASSAVTSHARGGVLGSHQSMWVRRCVVPASQAHCRPRSARSRRSAWVQWARSPITASIAPSRPGFTAPMRGRMKALSRCVCASTIPGSTGAPCTSQPWPVTLTVPVMGEVRVTRPWASSSSARAGPARSVGQSVGSSQRGSRALAMKSGAAGGCGMGVGFRGRGSGWASGCARSRSPRAWRARPRSCTRPGGPACHRGRA